MAETKKPAKLSDERAETLRQQLADHDRAVAEERREELKAKYKDVDKFLRSPELAKIVEKSEELKAGLASSSEDRNIYYALDNIRVGVEALKTTLEQRARAEGLSFTD